MVNSFFICYDVYKGGCVNSKFDIIFVVRKFCVVIDEEMVNIGRL